MIDLLADRSRKLPHIDLTGREMLISCGAALFSWTARQAMSGHIRRCFVSAS
jgi:hypothetical protein